MSPESADKQMVSIALQVRTARASRDWTQYDLAKRSGLSRPTIARIERGDDVSTSSLSRVAQALQLKLLVVPDADQCPSQ